MILEFLVHNFLFPKLQEYSVRPSIFLSLNSFTDSALPTFDQVPKLVKGDLLGVDITAEAAIAVDAKTGLVMYSKNSEVPRTIASITKLMTAIVFLEQKPNMDTLVKVREVDRHEGGMINFNIGETLTLKEVFNSALVASDNDAAYMLARNSGLSIEAFVERMNQKAKELGMEKSTFIEPTGLNKKNISTASDLVKLIEAAVAVPEISQATTSRSYVAAVNGLDDKVREVKLYNTDRLLQSDYLEVLGGKTGYLDEAGYCLAAKVRNKAGQEDYIVVLGSKTLEDRFQDLKALDYYIAKTYK